MNTNHHSCTCGTCNKRGCLTDTDWHFVRSPLADVFPVTEVIIDVLDVNDNGPVWHYPSMPKQDEVEPQGTRNKYIGAIANNSKPDTPVLMPDSANLLYPGTVFVSLILFWLTCAKNNVKDIVF